MSERLVICEECGAATPAPELDAEIERLTAERDEWKAKWIALAQASLIANVETK